jgi:hypothetical protein
MFLLASLKTPTNSNDSSESRVKFLFRLSFALFGGFSPMYIYCRFSEQFSESQAAFGTTSRVTGGFRKAGTSPLKRVRIFTVNK